MSTISQIYINTEYYNISDNYARGRINYITDNTYNKTSIDTSFSAVQTKLKELGNTIAVNQNQSNESQLSISQTGAFNNYGNNGQAFNAVRNFKNEPNNTKWKSTNGSGYILNAASFGVKDNGTTAFSHKKYDTFNKDNGTYTGAKNTAVLVFSGNGGLLYAKNTGSANDVTDDMYKYVGVIDSPDSRQKVYSAEQVDTMLKTYEDRINVLEEQVSQLLAQLKDNSSDIDAEDLA